MTKHTPPGTGRQRDRRWPPEPKETGLFVARPPLRQMTVMVDADLLDVWQAPAPGTPTWASIGDADRRRREHLGALLAHPMLEVLRYADDGPPPGTAADPRSTTTPVYPGWVHVRDPIPEGGASMASGSAILPTYVGWTLSGFMGNAGELAAQDTQGAFYDDLGPRVGNR